MPAAHDPSGFALASVFGAVAGAVPDQEVMVWRDRRITYAEMDRRADGLARFLVGQGLGCHTPRASLPGHLSGQDHLAIYSRNSTEYLEALIGSYRARVVPFNVNYRYVVEELVYLFADADARAIVFASEFAPEVAQLREQVPGLRVLVQIPDESGHDLLPGAVWWSDALAAPAPEDGMPTPTGDDVFMMYTGGTTGMPKGVLWRQDDVYVSSMGGTPFGTTEPFASYEAIAEHAASGAGRMTLLMIPPFMHAAAQWSTFHMITGGGTIVLPDNVHSFDPADALTVAARERCVSIPVIGDAIALPLIEEIERGDYDLSALGAINNGAAPLSPSTRERILATLPNIFIMDAAGASETGLQMSSLTAAGMDLDAGVFTPQGDTAVLDETMTRVLVPGEGGGWLARRDKVPLGYLGDAEKTARIFPEIDGVRWSVPGDRADVLPDGRIRLLGRDSVTINSGGEKIFAEEVESAVMAHPAVRDVICVGRPSERWGSEVVAIVQLAADAEVSDDELIAVAGEHVARYKLPKAILRVPLVQRSPSGKADYRWAKAQV